MDQHLIDILSAKISENQNIRAAAQTSMNMELALHYQEVMRTLSEIMTREVIQPDVREQAALVISHALFSVPQHSLLVNQWTRLRLTTRCIIKWNVYEALLTLHSSDIAVQCVALVGLLNIVCDEWPSVAAILVGKIVDQGSTENHKVGCLQALALMCINISDESWFKRLIDEICQTSVHDLREHPSETVRQTVENSLLQFVDIFTDRFNETVVRDTILKAACSGAQSTDENIVVVALLCLIKIMGIHYAKMVFTNDDSDDIYKDIERDYGFKSITENAMRSQLLEKVMLGIQLWVTVCEQEIIYEDDGYPGLPQLYVDELVPLLLEILEHHEKGDEDEWNPHKAAGECLWLLSQACEYHFVQLVISYVEHEDWRKRNVAVMAFGSVLESQIQDVVGELVTEVMPVIIQMLSDPVAVVRETAAWTVWRFCMWFPEMFLDIGYFPALLDAMYAALSSEPKIATHVCWAFSLLAEGAAYLDGEDQPGEAQTYDLSPHFDNIVKHLLQTIDRPDFAQSDLRNAASSALMEMIRSAPLDCYESIQHTMVVVLQKLDVKDPAALSAQDCSQLYEALQSVLTKINHAEAQDIAVRNMSVIMGIFERVLYNAMIEHVLDIQNPLFPQIISAFGDFILLLGDSFDQYRGQIKTMIQDCQAAVDPNDQVMIDCLDQFTMQTEI